MEQPQGNANNLQPQDLSLTCSLPAVMDLTRRSEECHPKASSMDPLRVVKSSSSWYTNSSSSKGLPFPEPSSDPRLHSGDQIQPDDAFSNTTVTLSYVSRSHVFSTHESQRSPLRGVPSISKFSLRPASCKLEEENDEMVGLNQEVSQRYPHQQGDRPLDPASQSQPACHTAYPIQATSENVAGGCRTRPSRELNGGHAAANGAVDCHRRRSTPPDRRQSQDAASSNGGLRNGRSSRADSGGDDVCADSLSDAEDGRPETRDSEVLVLISRTENPALLPDRSPRDMCAQGREYASPLEDPVSPSATSLEDVYLLPEASSSPSADNSLADASGDELERAGQETQASEGPASDLGSGESLEDARSVDLKPVIDLTDDGSAASEAPEDKAEGRAHSSHLNGHAKLAQSSFEKKKLPPRSGRGTRLEAIVMNINPTWYKVAGAVQPSKKIKATQSQIQTEISASEAVDSLSGGQEGVEENAALCPEIEIKQHSAPTLEQGKNSIHKDTDSYTESTSDLELTIPPQHTHSSFPPKSPHPATDEGSPDEESRPLSDPEPPSVVDRTVDSSAAKVEKKSPPKQKAKPSASKASPSAKSKTTSSSKRKRPKYNACQPSMFSPKEPEIRLKYLHYKEEKRDLRAADSFSPFVRVERKQVPSTCTVINYPEEDAARLKKGHQQASSGGFIPGAIPTTSCLQPGRVSTHGPYHNSLVCCLCGGSANALDLGDLHGPYYPEGYRPSAKTPACTGVKEEDEEEEDSDSDSSFSRRGRKCARPPGVLTHRPAPRHSQDKSLPGNHPRWSSYTERSSSPAAKRARPGAGAESLEAAGQEAGDLEGAGARTGPGGRATEDWYAPPVVPVEACEYWLHEDCCVWSAGVFLVKGKVFGLEEAVKVAQETTCSGCHNPGATLGCFFKGCPNKYHYRCALQLDCVLIEENFSMKCRKHKNKSLKAPPGASRDSR